MKKMTPISLIAALAVTSFSNAGDNIYGNPGYNWQPPEGDGPFYWSDASNWENDHQPTSFQAAIFDHGGTVKIPAATAENPFVEGSMFYPRVQNFARGEKLTIDGTGTYWLKKADPADTIASWNYLNLVDFGGYFWGGEGHDMNYVANNRPDDPAEWLATNVVIEISRAPAEEEYDSATLVLKQGYLNTYDPLGPGHTAHGHNFNLFHSGNRAKVIYEEGTHTRVQNFALRANAPDTLFWIKGGYHEFFGNLPVKNQNNQHPGVMKVSGGTVDVKTGWIIMSQADKTEGSDITPVGRLVLEGTAELCHTNNDTMYIGFGQRGSEGYFTMDGDSKAHLSNIHVGAREESVGMLEMNGNAELDMKDNGKVLYVGRNRDSVGRFYMHDNTKAILGQARVGAEDGNDGRPRAYGEFKMDGYSSAVISNQLLVGRSTSSTGIVELAGHATLTTLGSNIAMADSATNGYAKLVVKDDAFLEHGWIGVAYNPLNEADLIFAGNASNHVWDDNMGYLLLVARSSNSVGRAYFKDNSTTTFGQVRLGGDDSNRAHDTANGSMFIEDKASVTVKNHLYLGRAYNSTGTLDISGGSLNLTSGSQIIAGDASNAFTRVHMTGGKILAGGNISLASQQFSRCDFDMTGGELQFTGGGFSFNAGNYSSGNYYIGGDAKLNLTNCNCIFIGNGNYTDTDLVIGGNAELYGAKFWFANTGTTGSNPTLTIKDNAYVQWSGEHMALAGDSTNILHVTDNATLDLTGGINMGWRNDASTYSEVVFDGNMKLKGNGNIDAGGGSNPSVARVYFRGGSTPEYSSAGGCNVTLNGQDSLVEVSGGDFERRDLYVYQATGYANHTNTFRVTGGRIRFHEWTVVGNNNQLGRIEVDGGEFSTREINLGFGNMANDQVSVMRVTGGKVSVVHDNPGNDAWLQLGNNTGNTSHARLEQTGGEICTHAIRSQHNASGSAEAFFDGGKVTCSVKVHNDWGIIQGLTSAEVGETGLTIDSNGFNHFIKQAFTDADDGAGGFVDGKVTKTGKGSLDVRLNSDHAITVIDEGTLTFSNGADHFGRKIVLGAGTAIRVESGKPIKVDSVETAGTCYLDVDFVSGNGSYQIFDSATIDPAKLPGLRLRVVDPYKSYTWSADGKLTVADRVFTDAVWTGATSSAWDTAGNWNPETVPGVGSHAFFGDVQNRSVTVADGDETDIAEFTAAGYTFSGTDALKVNAAIVNDSEGTVTFSAPVEFGATAAIDGVAGGETVFSGGVAGDGASVVKSGSSKAVIGGTGEDFSGSWMVNGGTLGFSRTSAFGTASELTVGLGTLAYTAGNDTTVDGALVVKTGAAKRGAIVDVASMSTLTFTDARVESGSLVKKGQGTLKLDLGEGTFMLADTSVRWDNPDDDIAFPASGDSPASENMFNNLSVVEGRMVIEGEGSNVTKVVHQNGLAVGERYADKTAESELVLKNVYFDNNADANFSLGRVAWSTAFNEPSVRVLDGTYLHIHKAVIGWGSAVSTTSSFAVTNSTVQCNGEFAMAGGGNCHARLRVGESGKLRVNGNINVMGDIDVLVEGEGAEIALTNLNGYDDRWTWDGILRLENSDGRGRMVFRNGGSLTLGSRIHGMNGRTDGSDSWPGLHLEFDGGSLGFLANGTSIMCKPEYQGVWTEGDGMTFSVAADAVTTWAIPIRGAGGLVKTGAGTLDFVGVRAMTSWPQKVVDNVGYFDYQYDVTDIPNGFYAGDTEVREGTLRLSAAGSITNTTAVTVGGEGTLDLGGNSFTFASVGGSGVVENGSFVAPVKVAVNGTAATGVTPEFVNVALPVNQVFDLDFVEGEMDYLVPYTLSLTGYETAAMTGWRARVDNRFYRSDFTVDGAGHAVITLHHDLGHMLIVR